MHRQPSVPIPRPWTAAISSTVPAQSPLVPETGAIVEGGIEAQAHQMFKNCRAVLQAAGLDLGNVVKTTVFMTDLADFGKLNAIYGEYFTEPYPARLLRRGQRPAQGRASRMRVHREKIMESQNSGPGHARSRLFFCYL